MKIALIVCGIIIVAAIVFFFVQRTASVAATAKGGGSPVLPGIDPVTGARWQTVPEVNEHTQGLVDTASTDGHLS